ncbi:response regulator [Thetidibacter halocola]|uniref:Response regulator n=1 Tax=Thetidibacter halocola TaxID=2827239 RepID=A0A8J7WC56_9RHOB|nr:response regulator [Thetidibacter halocola]MBS0124822.1 response regulator [Thetidibacter halocola]
MRGSPGVNVLIVESDAALAGLWSGHLERMRCAVDIASTSEEACDRIRERRYNVIVLDLDLHDGGALSVADWAELYEPAARVIFVTNTTFFSDGSIFQFFNNACAFLPSATDPADLAQMVNHYGAA